MKTSPSEKTFLTELIQKLEQESCFPILLRNYKSFPDEIGNDLDIFVSKESLDTAFSILRDCAERQGGEICHVHRRGYFVAVWLRFLNAEKLIHVDLYHGALTWHGQRFLSDRELIQASRKVGDQHSYRIPAPYHEALVLLLASILWGGYFKVRYQDQIHSLISLPKEMKQFKELLKKNFAQDGTLLAEVVSLKEASTLVTRTFSNRLRRTMMVRGLLSAPLTSVRGWLEHWIEEATCYLIRRPGTVLEYRKGAFTPTQLGVVREHLGLYYGGVCEIEPSQSRLRKSATIWRLRGKNYLLIQESNRFAINGNLWNNGDPTPEDLIAQTLQVLSKRIPLQYP